MSFASPAALWALLLVPVAVAAYVAAQRYRRRFAVRFTNFDLLSSVVTQMPRWRRHVPPVLVLLAMSALVFALARPQADRRVPREEAGVVLALDRSGSMTATDVEPSRLEAARASAKRFVDAVPERFRIGLVAFATGAEVLVQPTVDREVVQRSLSSIVAGNGTAMGDAMARALELSSAGERGGAREPEDRSDAAPPFAIVLLSDGASTTGVADPLDVAGQAAAQRIPVYTIALGSDDAVVSIPGPGGVRTIPVPPDRATLEAVAETTGGRYFEAPTQSDLSAIYDGLGARIGYTTEQQDVTAPVVAGALVLLLGGAGASMAWFGRIP